MKRFLGVVAVAALLAVTAPPNAVAAESPALTELAGCVRQRGHLLVLALVDASGSLKRTDPDAARVVALQAAVASLRNLTRTENAGKPVIVELQVAAFSADFDGATPWTRLDNTSYPGLAQKVAEFADRDDGIDTDFATAVDGANHSLARRTAEIVGDGAGPPCQFMLMFTDGDYDIEPRTSAARRQLGMTKPYAPGIQIVDERTAEQVVDLGRHAVCGSGGLADDLRANGIVTATVALTPEISRTDQDFLRAMATGSAARQVCGSRGGRTSGLYLAADRISDLLFVLNRLIAGPGGGTELPGSERQRICDSRPDPACTREFEIDGSLRAFHVLADLGAPGLQVDLRSPASARPISFSYGPDGVAALGSAQVSSGWLSGSALALDVTLPPGKTDWIGTWSVTFIDPTGDKAGPAARSQIFVYGDLSPALVGNPVATLGETTPFHVKVIDQKGTPKTPRGLVRSATVTAVVVDPQSKVESPVVVEGPDADGTYSGTLTVDEASQASLLNLTLRLDVRTNLGLALAPTSRTYGIPVLPPPAFPSIAPSELSFGRMNTKKQVVRTLTVNGGSSGSGCVWIEGSGLDVKPRGVQRVELKATPNSADNCLRVAAQETKVIDVTASAYGRGEGALRGHLVVRMSSDQSDRVLTRQIPVSASMVIPVDVGTRNRWALLLLAAGLAVPIACLYLANRWLGRFAKSDALRHVALRVTTDGEIVRRGDTGAMLDVGPLEFSAFDGTDQQVRKLTAHGLDFRVRQPFTPVAAPWGTASSPAGYLTAQQGHERRGDGIAATLPLNLAGEWVFELETYEEEPDEVTTVTGVLHMIVPDSASGVDTQPIVDKAQRELPSRALALAELKASETEAAPPVDEESTLPPPPSWLPSEPPSGPPRPPYDDAPDAPRQAERTSTPYGAGHVAEPPSRPLPKPPEY